jgi:peptidyl-prolyl cis-trans isomerase C
MGKQKYGKGFQKKSKSTQVSGKKIGGAPIRGGKMRVKHILVEKYSQAKEIYENLKIGGRFEELARQYSTCPSKKSGGDLGDFSKGDMVPEFWNACVKLDIDEISQPIKTKFGYHVIKRIV